MATEVMTIQKTEAPAELWMIITEIHRTSLSTCFTGSSWYSKKFLLSSGSLGIYPLIHVTVWTWRGFLADLEMYAQNIQAQVIARFTQISKGAVVSADWYIHIYAENV